MLVKMYINAHYICAMCRNSKSVAKKVAIFSEEMTIRKCWIFCEECAMIAKEMEGMVIGHE